MKRLLLISILFLLLSYSGKSQITITSNSICFDSIAAVKLLKQINYVESTTAEMKLYDEIISKYDSTIIADQRFIRYLRLQNDTLVSRCNDINIRIRNEITEVKKQRKRIIIYSGSTIAILLTCLLLK